MSKLLTEISRIRELMGIKSEVLKESLSSSGRQRLQELLISLLKLSDNDATAFFKNLTEEDQNLLRTLINSSDGKIAGNLSDAVTIASLRNFLKNGGTDAIKSVLAKTERLLAKELSEKSAKIGYNLLKTSADVQKFLKAAKTSTGGNLTVLDILIDIEQKGGIEKSTIFDGNPEMWGFFYEDLEKLKFNYKNKTDGVYDYLEKISNDILKMSDPDIEAKEKINLLLEKNLLEEAANEYKLLNWEEAELKNLIQKKLDEKFGSDTIILYSNILEEYIIQNKDKLTSLTKGNSTLNFDKEGNPSNSFFPILHWVPKKSFASFDVYLNTKAQLKIETNDSILVSIEYSSNVTKPIYIDSDENFYFKSKKGLPLATILYDSGLPDKIVYIEKTYKSEKLINGILIYSNDYRTINKKEILKSDKN